MPFFHLHGTAHILLHDKNEVFFDEFTGEVLQSGHEEEANALPQDSSSPKSPKRNCPT
ncbi:MAG TPA: hypothetical protein VJ955_02815 [Desulfuromonadales bacterium]|nr:hypothetical protein [Desulfuromonadales bacterium]